MIDQAYSRIREFLGIRPKRVRKRNAEEEQAWFFLARSKKLAYLQVPKAGCSSIKTALCLINRPELKAELAAAPMEIHTRLDWNDIVFCDAPMLRSYFCFTFVRHPTERFTSFLRNKIIAPEGGELEDRFTKLGFHKAMPVMEILDIMEAMPVDKLDPHIVPQARLVSLPTVKPLSYIGKLEEMAAGLAEIERRTGVALQLGHENSTRSLAGRVGGLTAEELGRVERFYAEDYRRFGYERQTA